MKHLTVEDAYQTARSKSRKCLSESVLNNKSVSVWENLS